MGACGGVKAGAQGLQRVEFRDLGLMPYAECWQLQQQLFDELQHDKKCGAGRTGHILVVEHPAVYTLGKSGKSGNILFGEEQLAAIGAEYYHIDRGGDVTFHGPGQIVLYPILDLEQLGIGLREYISALEQAVIDTLAHWGVEAKRSAGAAGVWITRGAGESSGTSKERGAASNLGTASNRGAGENPEEPNRGAVSNAGTSSNKICAIGVKSSRYITMHGLALNVATDLKYFNYINPCGFTDRGVTSLECEVGAPVSIDQVKELLLNNLTKIINVKIYKK